MEEMVYLNGSFLPLREAKIQVTDYGFLFGYGLYETMRAYDGKFFRLDEHLARFQRSLKMLEIRVDSVEIRRAVFATVHRNGLESARVRVTVSPGSGSLTPDPATCSHLTLLITAAPYAGYPADTYREGFKAIISTARRNSQSALSGMKTTCFLESILARKEARAAGVDDALLLNDKGTLAEASSSNLFLVKEGILKTPKVGSGLLPGITRDTVLELAAASGIDALETEIQPDELGEAEEAFLTNSLMEVMPLVEVNGEKIGQGKPGAVTRQLAAAYEEQVANQSRAQ
jgi:branched-chain amino acid aminotransferase